MIERVFQFILFAGLVVLILMFVRLYKMGVL